MMERIEPESYESNRGYYKAALLHRRDGFIDDLPTNLVTFNDLNYMKYKCRGNYFTGLLAELYNLQADNLLIDLESSEKLSESISWIESLDFKEFRTRQDIDRVNGILNYFIMKLQ